MPAAPDDRRLQLDTLAVILLVGCCLLWGIQQVVVKATLPHIPPMLQAALRSGVAALAVWAWAAWRGLPVWPRTGDGTAWPGILAGALFGLEFLCIYVGLEYTGASRMVVLLYLSPFIVAAGMPFIVASEKLGPMQVFGLVLGFCALILAFGEGLRGGGDQAWIGDLLAVAAAILWGATTLVIRATRLSHAVPEKTLFLQLAVSAPILAAASVLTGEAWPATWTSLMWGSMVFQALIVAFASYLVWFWLIRHYPATRLASFTFLTPLFGLVFGVLLLGESLSLPLIGALAGVAAGIWLVNRKPALPRT